MTCDRRLASYYRDGALSLEERYEFEAHMRECDACTGHLRSQMRLAQVVRSLPMEPAPPTLRTAVYHQIAELPTHLVVAIVRAVEEGGSGA